MAEGYTSFEEIEWELGLKLTEVGILVPTPGFAVYLVDGKLADKYLQRTDSSYIKDGYELWRDRNGALWAAVADVEEEEPLVLWIADPAVEGLLINKLEEEAASLMVSTIQGSRMNGDAYTISGLGRMPPVYGHSKAVAAAKALLAFHEKKQ